MTVRKTCQDAALQVPLSLTRIKCIIGSNMCLSFVSIPAVMQAPAPLAAKQWYTVFTRGGSFGIPFALGGALATAYVASQRTF
jgi:hypothetical protein